MQNRNLRIQRVTRLSVVNKRHSVYDKDHVIACVSCIGNHDYSYVLYDESKEERVQTFIRRLDKQRSKTYACEVYYGIDPSEIWPLVA